MLRTMLGPLGATEVQHLDLQEEGKKESSLCVYHSFWCESWWWQCQCERSRVGGKMQIEGDLQGITVMPLNMLSLVLVCA